MATLSPPMVPTACMATLSPKPFASPQHPQKARSDQPGFFVLDPEHPDIAKIHCGSELARDEAGTFNIKGA
jgi:hypothetical protein